MINPQWLELPMSRTNFHGPKDVRASEVRLYMVIQMRPMRKSRGLLIFVSKTHTIDGDLKTMTNMKRYRIKSLFALGSH